jgi:hypothetical protein
LILELETAKLTSKLTTNSSTKKKFTRIFTEINKDDLSKLEEKEIETTINKDPRRFILFFICVYCVHLWLTPKMQSKILPKLSNRIRRKLRFSRRLRSAAARTSGNNYGNGR